MKLYAKIKNDKGRQEGLGGNDHLDIDIMVGNQILDSLVVKRGNIPETDGAEGWVLYDYYDEPIAWLEDKKKGQTIKGKACIHGRQRRDDCIGCSML